MKPTFGPIRLPQRRLIWRNGPNLVGSLIAFALAGCGSEARDGSHDETVKETPVDAAFALYSPYNGIVAENVDSAGKIFVSPQFRPVLNGNGSIMAFLENGPIAPIAADKHTNSLNDTDVYVRNRSTKTYSVLPISIAAGNRASVDIGTHGMDSAGRYVTATSIEGPSFEPNRSRTLSILLWDRNTNQVTTIDRGTVNYDWPPQSSISADGTTVAYVDLSGTLSIYTRSTGVKQVLRGTTGQPIVLYYNQKPVLSGDGKLVFFNTFADYVDPTLPHENALFVANRTTGTVEAARMDIPGQPLLSVSEPSVSTDGRMVAFYETTLNIGDGSGAIYGQIYVFDRTTRKCTRLSSPAVNGIIQPGQYGNAYSIHPVISANGRRVAFTSNATNLLGDNTTTQDVYVADTATLELTRVSIGDNGQMPNNHSGNAAISGDGNTVCFETTATNLIGTSNNTNKIYCRTLADAPILTGVVTDINNGAIAGVTVEAGGQYATTDAYGRYQISGLKLGTYVVHAQKTGYTFGTDEYATLNRSVDLRKTVTQNITGYNRQPLVYAPGYADSGSVPYYKNLGSAGYKIYVAPIDNDGLVPSRYTNARVLRNQINQAKAETGQDKVILAAFSLGGIVSRAYLEDSEFYQGDVSQFFDYGSPHWGFPPALDPDLFASVGLNVMLRASTPGIMDMTELSMALFNVTHPDRASGVPYHLIGGAAPLWTTKTWSFKIPFVPRVRISIPWPDTSSRNWAGWALGAYIWGDDDALFTAQSTTMLHGSIDRLVTKEVHVPSLGPRWYKEWNGGSASQTYSQCFKRVLIDGGTTCGTVSNHSLVSDLATQFITPELVIPGFVSETPVLRPPAPLPVRVGRVFAGAVVQQTITITGGPATFTANLPQGSAKITLIDPSGRRFTPEYAASLISDDDTSAPTSTQIDNGVVAYTGGTNGGSYFVPNAMAGQWTMLIEGGSDIPAGGVAYSATGQEYSTLTMKPEIDRHWYAPGASATFTARFSEAVQNATVTGTIKLANGTSNTVTFTSVGNNTYRANYAVPNAGGVAYLKVLATGKNKSGVAFERGGNQQFMVMVDTIGLLGTYNVSTEVSPRRSDKYSALLVDVGVSANTATKATLSARLVDSSGNTVARVLAHPALNAGNNTVQLRFSGADIFKSGRNGPYRVTDVSLIEDRTEQSLLAKQVANVVTTAGYSYTAFEGNLYQGHTYEAYSNNVTWAQAKAACETANAHLVTIGSEGENEFVRSLAAANVRSWIGFTDAQTEGKWQWTTGEANWFRKWDSGEPNNVGGAENWAAMYGSSGLWLDLPATWTAGYVCEWETKPSQWTEWFNRDSPSGNGDNESLGYFTQEGKACTAPLAVECRRVSDQKNWEDTGALMTCTPSGGGLCINASQPSGSCDDIEVRFLCPKP